MKIKFTEDQLQAVKGIIEFTELFCDQVWQIMVNHGLDKVKGCALHIDVDPELDLTTKSIHFGESCTDAGSVFLSRGKEEDHYAPFGTNSPEYELMFAQPAVKEMMQNILAVKVGKHEKQTPPDGLWV